MRIVVAIVVAVGLLIVAGFVVAWSTFSSAELPIGLGHACEVRSDMSRGTATGTASEAPDKVAFEADQLANAATITAVAARRKLPEHAVVVALATALQESKLRNLSGGDRDSIGLFQQRPSQGWGTAEQIADPRYAAGKFYDGLMKINGWQTMRVTDAAQAVQRSNHPELYEQWADEGAVLSRALLGNTVGAVACTPQDKATERGAAAATSLAASLRLDWGQATPVTSAESTIGVTAAEGRIGWRYAHWLVAHAEQRGVTKVTYADREWTAKSGAWVAAKAPSTGKVLAEVRPAQ